MKTPRPAASGAPAAPLTAARFGWAAACTYLLALTVIVYAPALAPGKTFLPADLVMLMPPWSHHAGEIAPDWHAVARPVWDPLFQFYPARKFLAESIRAGIVPWHNPSSFSGTPFVADGQSAFFYPINWLFAALPLARAFGIVAALHTLLAGVFFTMFARRKGCGWEASLAGATVWMLCGTMTAWQMWQVVHATLCWLPLGLYFADRVITKREARDAPWPLPCMAGLAAAVGMTLLAGHLQFAFDSLLVIGLYCLFTLVRRRTAQPVAALLASLLAGIAIASVQILPTLDLLKHSLRGNYSLSDLLQTALPWSHLGLLLMPEVAGGERDWQSHPYLGAVNYYEVTCYVGAAALFFAGVALAWRDPDRRSSARFWAAVALLGLLIGCGSPVYSALYYGIPLFKSFHGVARTLVLTEFAVAVLCALGIEGLLTAPEGGRDGMARSALLRAAGGVALAVIAGWGVIASRSTGNLPYVLTHDWLLYGMTQAAWALAALLAALLVAIFAAGRTKWAVVAVVAADMLGFAAGLNPGAESAMLYPDLPSVAAMRAAQGGGRTVCLGSARRDLDRMIPNSAMSAGLGDVSGSDPLILAGYDRFLAALNTAQTGAPAPNGGGIVAQGGSPGLDDLDVQAVVSPVPISVPGYAQVYGGDVFIYRNVDAVGEARVVGSWTVDPAPDAGWSRLLKSPPTAADTVAIDAAVPPPPSPASGRAGTVTSARRSAEESVAAAEASRPALIEFSEIADPAWKAAVDGASTPWVTVDGLFVGVPVGAGRHIVRLAYLPGPGWVGLYFACAGWLALLGWLGYSLGRGRKGR